MSGAWGEKLIAINANNRVHVHHPYELHIEIKIRKVNSIGAELKE